MCRFAVYLGADIRIASLLTEPTNSIIRQSFHSYEGIEPFNGDGFGIAWYPGERAEEPALFRSTSPAWSNRNLREVARVTSTRCLLAHVRAASPGIPVTELNCHPFANGALTFMHNGSLGGFRTIRRKLLAGLSDDAFSAIEGSTDSEHVFAVARDRLAALPETLDPLERMARALEQTIGQVEAIRRREAPETRSLLNLVLCDGERTAITRYASDGSDGNSLYYTTGRTYVGPMGLCRIEDEGDHPSAVVVASEPLDESHRWTRVLPQHLLLVERDLTVTMRELASADASAPGRSLSEPA